MFAILLAVGISYIIDIEKMKPGWKFIEKNIVTI